MKELKKSFIHGFITLCDALIGLMYCAIWYESDWFPRDVLMMEFRLAGYQYELDMLGVAMLILCIAVWHYFRTVVIHAIIRWSIGITLKLREMWDDRFNNEPEDYYIRDVG